MHIRRMREPGLTGSAADAPLPKDGVQVVARPFTGKPAGVLIVEDKTLIAGFIDAVLGISGFRVVGIAGSGPEDLFLAGETRPALALVDIMPPHCAPPYAPIRPMHP